MVDIFRGKDPDKDCAREYVRYVFALGRETCQSVGSAIQMTTSGDVSFPVTDDTSLEISIAILGTSIAILKGHSKIMSRDRGTQIESWCKHSIGCDCDLPPDATAKLTQAIDEYQAAFQKAMDSDINPFGETSGRMLARCLGPDVKALCVKGTSNLNPFVHQVVGDLLIMTVTQATAFWEKMGKR